MTAKIYSGLTNNEAFNLMTATIQCRQELPALLQWSARRHWIWGCCIAAALFLTASIAGFGLEANPLGPVSGLIGTAIIVSGTWWSARRTMRRRQFLEATAVGLKQFAEAAATMPGANSKQIHAAMPD